jgi:hypothetical protein
VSDELHTEDPLHTVERYCMFVGYPRSGHSLVGALLNAHPELLIANELDALSRVREGIDREALFAEILAADRDFAARGRRHMGFEYAVPGAWQGRFSTLRVIGDKKGGRSSWWLHDEPELLPKLRALVGLPLRFVHVVRSPWDNIATIARRHALSLDEAIAWYFDTCAAVAGIFERIPEEERHTLHHEELVADPKGQLAALARFLEVSVDEGWLEACAAVVRPAVNRSRAERRWSEAQRREVERRAAGFVWLRPEALGETTDGASDA